jgi:hypothetical protein
MIGRRQKSPALIAAKVPNPKKRWMTGQGLHTTSTWRRRLVRHRSGCAVKSKVGDVKDKVFLLRFGSFRRLDQLLVRDFGRDWDRTWSFLLASSSLSWRRIVVVFGPTTSTVRQIPRHSSVGPYSVEGCRLLVPALSVTLTWSSVCRAMMIDAKRPTAKWSSVNFARHADQEQRVDEGGPTAWIA